MADRPHIPVYAHRFGSEYGPESSRVALEKSLARDVEGLECDVILSGDDEVFGVTLAMSTRSASGRCWT